MKFVISRNVIRYRSFGSFILLVLSLQIGNVSAVEDQITELETEFLRDYQSGVQISRATEQRLHHLLFNPIDLATASQEHLTELPGIGQVLARRIVVFRQTGALLNISDLLQVKGISSRLLQKIEPFLSISDSGIPDLKRDRFKGNVEMGFLYGSGLGREGSRLDESLQQLPVFLKWDVSQKSAGSSVDSYASISYRETLRSSYDTTCECFHAIKAGEQLRFDSINLFLKYPRHKFLIGHYQAGFAQKLVFDQTSRRQAEGFYRRIPVKQDLSRVRLSSPDRLFGVAYSWQPVSEKLARVDWFASLSYPDIYQYDLRYGLNSYQSASLPDCPGTSSSGDYFTCDDTKGWYQTRIQAINGDSDLTYQTLSGRFSQSLLGWHLKLRASPQFHFGMVSYRASIEFTDNSVEQWFSPSARYPDIAAWRVTGIYANYLFKAWRFGGEYAFMPDFGHAYFFKINHENSRNLTYQQRFRLYSSGYKNPYSHAYASESEYEGTRQRNEAGTDIRVRYKPGRAVLLNFNTDIWFRPWQQTNTETYYFDSTPVVNSEHRLGGEYERGSHTWTLYYSLVNKDVLHNGVEQSYYSASSSEYGKGEKHRFSLSWKNRYSRNLTSKIVASRVAVSEGGSEYTTEQRLAFLITQAGIYDWKFNTRVTLRFSEVRARGDYLYDREAPQFGVRQYASRKVGKNNLIKLTLGYDEYLEQRPERYPSYLFYRMLVQYQL